MLKDEIESKIGLVAEVKPILYNLFLVGFQKLPDFFNQHLQKSKVLPTQHLFLAHFLEFCNGIHTTYFSFRLKFADRNSNPFVCTK